MSIRDKLAQIKKTAVTGNTQIRSSYVGVTPDSALDFAQVLEDSKLFALDVNACSKAVGLVVQLKSVTKPSCVFSYWTSGKAQITGTLPIGIAVPEDWTFVPAPAVAVAA